MGLFKNENINITKLQSRPTQSFKSMFYLDFQGHIDDENVCRAINNAKNNGHEIRFLGSYIDQNN